MDWEDEWYIDELMALQARPKPTPEEKARRDAAYAAKKAKEAADISASSCGRFACQNMRIAVTAFHDQLFSAVTRSGVNSIIDALRQWRAGENSWSMISRHQLLQLMADWHVRRQYSAVLPLTADGKLAIKPHASPYNGVGSFPTWEYFLNREYPRMTRLLVDWDKVDRALVRPVVDEAVNVDLEGPFAAFFADRNRISISSTIEVSYLAWKQAK